jgi:hypothetical protein
MVGGEEQNVMATKVVRVNRVPTPTGVSNVAGNEVTSWSVGDRLLMIFAVFVALVLSVSGLALLVISMWAFFQ